MPDLAPLEQEIELMASFDAARVPDQATKERIRHKISMRVTEQVGSQPFSEYLSEYLSFGCGTLAVAFSGLLAAMVLAIHWSPRHLWRADFVSVAIAMLVWFGGFLCYSLRTRKAFEWLGPAWDLIVAAMAVLGIRILPAPDTAFTSWVTAGARAALTGIIVFTGGMLLTHVALPLVRYLLGRRQLSHHPEAAIVTGLLKLLAHLQLFQTGMETWEQLILETLARQKRRDEALRKLAEAETQGAGSEQARIRKVAVLPYMTDAYTFELQRGDEPGRTIGRESTTIRRKGDTFVEAYRFECKPNDGEWKIVEQEERALPGADLFVEGEQWNKVRKEFVGLAMRVAQFIEMGLFAKMSVGEPSLDTWLSKELQQRSETIRGWTKSVVLPSQASFEELFGQIGAAVEFAAEERWMALPKSELAPRTGFRQQILQLVRNTIVGLVPLGVAIVPPFFGYAVPPSVRDPLLTFAIPWILLQFLELLVPNANDYFSRSKDIRAFLSAPIARLTAGK